MSKRVFLLLPVHNRVAITAKFLDCLIAQSYTNYHLILIDDGSTDGTSEMVASRIGRLTILRGTGDWWWAGSLQKGIAQLQNIAHEDDIIVFINDDITFAQDFLMKGVTLLEQYGGMLLPQILNEQTGAIEESGVEANLKRLTFKTATGPARINCLPTRGLFMNMSVLKKVGGFYPKLLPHYLSDYEYTIRAHRLGVSLTTSPDLTICSDKGATGYRELDNESLIDFLRNYFSTKSTFNPIYWTTFALLVSPGFRSPLLLLIVWARSARHIFRKIAWLMNRDNQSNKSI